MKWMLTLLALLFSNYAFAFTDPDITAPESSQQKDARQAMENAKPLFFKWFNVVVVNEAEVEQAAANLVNEYLSKLKNCEQGTFKYPTQNYLGGHRVNNELQPAYILNVATVISKADNICEVTTTIYTNPTSQNQCDYTLKSLAAISKPVDIKLSQQGDSSVVGAAIQAAQDCHQLYSVMTDSFSNSQRVFAEKLQQCAAGSYLVGNKIITLSGFKDDKCGYQSVHNMDGKDIVVHCKFSKASIDVLTLFQLARLDGHPKFYRKSSPAEQSAMTQAMKECDIPDNPF